MTKHLRRGGCPSGSLQKETHQTRPEGTEGSPWYAVPVSALQGRRASRLNKIAFYLGWVLTGCAPAPHSGREKHSRKPPAIELQDSSSSSKDSVNQGHQECQRQLEALRIEEEQVRQEGISSSSRQLQPGSGPGPGPGPGQGSDRRGEKVVSHSMLRSATVSKSMGILGIGIWRRLTTMFNVRLPFQASAMTQPH